MATKHKGPFMPNIQAIEAMGVNPKTGLPYKMGSTVSQTKDVWMKQLRISDQQNFVNRFYWYGLPRGLNSQDIERMLYYKYQVCMWWSKEDNKFYVTPFALEGQIDLYGRPTTVYPIPLCDGVTQDQKAKTKMLAEYLKHKKLRVLWDVPTFEELVASPEMLENCCVIIQDYTPQISQSAIPRQILNDGIIDFESDLPAFMRTALLNATGVRGVRVNTEDESFQVYEASKSMNDAALVGQKYIPMIGDGLDFQDFTDGTVGKAEDFLLAMQSIDNMRLGALGLGSNAIFEKKAHELQTEANMAQGSVSLILEDSLLRRQTACQIAAKLWGIPMSVNVSEPASGFDANMDGVVSQNKEPDPEMEAQNELY